jgi:hypothetical protein
MRHITTITTPALAEAKQENNTSGFLDIFNELINLLLVSIDAMADVFEAIVNFASTDGTFTKENA